MTLPITYVDGNTIHGTDVDSWTEVVNALTAFISPPGATIVAGFTTTVTSVTTITLTVTSTTMQVLTGANTQTVKLPTTSVVAGAVWIISNQASATATIQSSGANTIITVPAGGTTMFTALTATPTTAAGWTYATCDNFPEFQTTATAAGTTALTLASPQVQVFTGTTTQTVTLPTTSVPAGAQWQIVNQSTGAVTVQSSGSNTVTILAAGTSGVFTAVVATPTTAANWASQYGGVSVASGKALQANNTLTLAAPTDGVTFTIPGANAAALAAPVADIAVGGTTKTKILASNAIPANTLTTGSTFRVRAFGTQGAATSSIYYAIYIGTSGTTGDVLVASNVAGIALSLGASFEGTITIQSTGGAGTVIGSSRLTPGTGVTSVTTNTTAVAVNTGVQNFVTLGMATSTNTHTVQTAVIAWEI